MWCIPFKVTFSLLPLCVCVECVCLCVCVRGGVGRVGVVVRGSMCIPDLEKGEFHWEDFPNAALSAAGYGETGEVF